MHNLLELSRMACPKQNLGEQSYLPTAVPSGLLEQCFLNILFPWVLVKTTDYFALREIYWFRIYDAGIWESVFIIS